MKKHTASIILSGAMLCAAAGNGETGGSWNFDSSQTLYRSNGMTLHGQASPAKGIVGGGVHFDGKDQYLSLNLSGNAQPGEEMTAAFWFKTEPGSACFPAVRHSNSYFVASGGPGFSWYEITGVNGRVYDGYAHPRLLNYNEWYHFALVYNQRELAVYLDGRKIRSVKAVKLGAVKPGGSMMIGGHLARFNNRWLTFKGTMDEVELLKYAKTDWTRVRLLKQREYLKQFRISMKGKSDWLRRFGAFSDAVEKCQSDERAAELLVTAETLRKDGENLLYGTSAGLFVRTVNAMTRVMPDDFLLIPAAGKAYLSMAGNERENLQLLITPQNGDLKTFTAELPEQLTDQQGNPGNFTLKISETEYTRLHQPSHWMYQVPAVPDKLIERKQFTFSPRFTPLWLEVKSGEDTAPGIYTGKIRFTADNGKTLELPLEVKVYDFSLPRRNIVPSIVSIWERDLQTYLQHGDVKKFMELLTAYADMVIEHRLNPVIMHQGDLVADWVRKGVYPDYRVSADGKAQINWTYYDQLVDHLREKGLSTVVMGPYYRSVEIWKKSRNQAAVWQEIRRHAEEKGYLADTAVYPIDEWSTANRPEINAVGETVTRNAPGMRWLMTPGSQNAPYEGIRNVGLWIPQFHWVNMPAMRRLQQSGIPVWSYVCTGPQFPVPNLHQDTPAAGIRMVPVANMRFGFDGILHWAVNFNTGKNAKDVSSYGAREGCYIYADENGYPVPTVRLKNFADGMEDWIVMEMLKQRDPAAHEEMMEELAKLIPGREFDSAMKITETSPREATYHTFMKTDAFYPVISQPEKYLAWREKLYEVMSAAGADNL